MGEFDLRKTVSENASIYFEKSKKLKNKIDGINETVKRYILEKEKAEKNKENAEIKLKEEEELKNRKKEWYERFRWFYTSKGSLCIGGRDASTNEQIIKKYTDETDLVFHTDMSGSPFFVLKSKTIPTEIEKYEVASVTACYSKAWKSGLSKTDVFCVNPNQISKETKSGEYISKGSFIIKGKTNYIDHEMKIIITLDEEQRVTFGSTKSIKNKDYVILTQGSDKTSDVAKKLRKFFGSGLLDDYVKVIPPGGAKIFKTVKHRKK